MICDWFMSSDEYGCNYPGVKDACYKLCTGCWKIAMNVASGATC